MEALLGRPRASTISALEGVCVLKFPASGLNISEHGAVRVAKKVHTDTVGS